MFVGMGVFVAGEAKALPTTVNSYVFYSGTQIVGQSILYCDGTPQHWGDAPSTGIHNAVAVTYSCGNGNATRVSYPTTIDPWIHANFCLQSGVCEVGPKAVPEAGVFEPGLYSD